MIPCPSNCVIIECDQTWALGKPCPYCPEDMYEETKLIMENVLWLRQASVLVELGFKPNEFPTLEKRANDEDLAQERALEAAKKEVVEEVRQESTIYYCYVCRSLNPSMLHLSCEMSTCSPGEWHCHWGCRRLFHP